jgi:HEPN domain-containing protein
MNIWDILEIAETNNIADIKRAYSKKLKVYHPEDDPTGYQNLREAYDKAIKYAKKSVDDKTKHSSFNNLDDTEDEAKDYNNIDDYDKQNTYVPPHVDIFKQYTEENKENQVDDFFSELQKLYDNDALRNEIKNWEAIFDSSIVWELNSKKLIVYKMIKFLANKNNLSHNIWRIVDKIFDFTKNSQKLYEKYDKADIDFILKNINDFPELSLSYINNLDDSQWKQYIEYREKANIKLKSKNYNEALAFLENAFEIYSKDPDLLRMFGQYYFYRNDLNASLSYLNQAIGFNKDDFLARYYRAQLYGKKNDRKALIDLDYICEYYKDKSDYIKIMGKIYFKFNEIGKARELFIRFLRRHPGNYEAKQYLSKILDILNIEVVKQPQNIQIRNEVQEICQLLRIKKFNKFLYLQRHLKKYAILFIVILFILIRIIVTHLESSNLAFSYQNICNFLTDNKKITEIKNPKELLTLRSNDIIKANISQAEWMDIYQLTYSNNKLGYVTSEELDSKNLSDYISGYIYTGKIGDKKLVFVVDYNDTGKIDKTNAFSFQGSVNKSADSSLFTLVKDTYKKYDMKYKDTDDFITSVYLDKKVTSSSDNIIALVPIYFFSFVDFLIILRTIKIIVYFFKTISRKDSEFNFN